MSRKRTDRSDPHDLYEAIFDAIGTAALVIDQDTGILNANEEATRFTGYTAEQLRTMKWSDIATRVGPAHPTSEHRADDATHRIMVTGPSGRSQAALLTERPIAGTDRRVLTVSTCADLDANDEKYRQLFEVESDALFLLDGETADILDANPAAFRLYQYDREALIGMNAITLTAEPEELAAMLHNPVGRIPLRYHRKADGTVFPVEILYNDFEHRGRRTRIVTVRDITERVSTEQQTVEQGKFDQLRVDLWELVGAPCESERELISTVLAHIGGVMDLSRVSLWRRDPETGDFALVHQWYSKRSLPSNTTFISREQARLLFGKPHVVLPDDAVPALAESVRQAFYDEDIVACLALPCGEGEEPESFATFSECGDKQEWRQLEIDYLQEAVRIIQLRSAEIRTRDQLRDNEARLNEVEEIARVGGWDYDVGTRRIAWTKEVYALHGVDPEKYDPNDIEQDIRFYAPEDRERIEHAFTAAVQEGKPYELALRFKNLRGEPMLVRTSGKPIIENGTVVRIIGHFADITKRETNRRYVTTQTSVLELLNTTDHLPAVIDPVVETIRRQFELDTVSIHVRAEHRYPFSSRSKLPAGLTVVTVPSPEHEETEVSALQTIYDAVMTGRTVPDQPFISDGGSFWTNSVDDFAVQADHRHGGMRYQSIAWVPIRSRNHVIGLLELTDHRTNRFSTAEIGYFESMCNSIGQAFERSNLLTSLQKSTALLEEAQELGRIGSWEFDPNDGELTWSPQTFVLYERDPQLGPPTPEEEATFYTAEIAATLREFARLAIEHGQTAEFDLSAHLPSGKDVFFHSAMRPIMDDSGTVVRLRGTVQDITERKKNEARITKDLEEKDVLLRELFHRTKNNMQVVASILALRSQTFQDPEVAEAFEDVEEKILTIAAVHQRVYESDDLSHLSLSDYIRDLIAMVRERSATRTTGVQIHEHLADIKVVIDTAIPTGLIGIELLTNAIKHGFPSRREGTVTVRLTAGPDSEIVLEIEDDGIGLPEDFNIEHDARLGLQTALDLARTQLHGSLEITSTHGVHCRLTISEELYQPRV